MDNDIFHSTILPCKVAQLKELPKLKVDGESHVPNKLMLTDVICIFCEITRELSLCQSSLLHTNSYSYYTLPSRTDIHHTLSVALSSLSPAMQRSDVVLADLKPFILELQHRSKDTSIVFVAASDVSSVLPCCKQSLGKYSLRIQFQYAMYPN